MATTAGGRRRPLTPFESIARTLADLPDVAVEWDALSVDERMSWSLDWSNEMAKLELLARRATAHDLSRGEAEQFGELLRRIDQAVPIIDRLSLRRPSVPFEDPPSVVPRPG